MSKVKSKQKGPQKIPLALYASQENDFILAAYRSPQAVTLFIKSQVS